MRYRVVRWPRGEREAKEPALRQIFTTRGVADRTKCRLQAKFPDYCFAVELTAAQFELGTLVVEKDAMKAIEDAGQTPAEFFNRHALGDLGDIEAVGAIRQLCATSKLRILSNYKTRKNEKLMVITEVDRMTTTISLRNGQ